MIICKTLERILGALTILAALSAKIDRPICAQAIPTISGDAREQKGRVPTMVFDVVSIHPSKSGGFKLPDFDMTPGDRWTHNGNLYTADVPVTAYIGFAYDLWLSADQLDALVAHRPSWVGHENIQIEMRASGDPTKEQVRMMMRSMLADRFKLAVHFEPQTRRVFALTTGKSGKLGPNLRLHADGPPCDMSNLSAIRRGGDDFESLLPPTCGTYRIIPKPNHIKAISAREVTMPLIASFIASNSDVGGIVVDQTGLQGTYDFSLEWLPLQSLSDSTGNETGLGPALSQSIEQQLGLKLINTKSNISTLIVDNIERPTEN
jgi:bla regulator protein blaR1